MKADEVTQEEVNRVRDSREEMLHLAELMITNRTIVPLSYKQFVNLFVATVSDKDLFLGDPNKLKFDGSVKSVTWRANKDRARLLFNRRTFKPPYLVHALEDDPEKRVAWRYVDYEGNNDLSWLGRTKVAVDEVHAVFTPLVLDNIGREIFINIGLRYAEELEMSLFTATPYPDNKGFMTLLQIVTADYYQRLWPVEYKELMRLRSNNGILLPAAEIDIDKDLKLRTTMFYPDVLDFQVYIADRAKRHQLEEKLQGLLKRKSEEAVKETARTRQVIADLADIRIDIKYQNLLAGRLSVVQNSCRI